MGKHYLTWFLLLAILAAASWVALGLALKMPQVVSLETDSLIGILRTFNWILLFGFFLVLMGRHLVMLGLSVAESVSRARDSSFPSRTKPNRSQNQSARYGGSTIGSSGDSSSVGSSTLPQDSLPNEEPKVSVIVPAFNEGPCIEATIKSLIAVDYPNLEVVVVDDGSTDDTLTKARKLQGKHGFATVTVISTPNRGKCAALNEGISKAAGQFIAVVDADSILTPSSLTAAMERLADPTVGAVAGKVVVLNRVNILSRMQHIEYLKGLNMHRRAQGFIHAVGIVPGPVGIFRRTAMEDVGGYDNDTFAEDFDLTVKLIKAGWKVDFEPGAIALTEAPESLLPLVKQRYRWTRGILQVIKKHLKSQFFTSGSGSAQGRFTLLYFILEGLIMPFFNMIWVSFLMLSLFSSATMNAALGMWLQLVILEMITTLFCLGEEDNNLLPVLLVPAERWIYQPLLDTVRVLASIEEFFGVRMLWGKLSRKGRAA